MTADQQSAAALLSGFVERASGDELAAAQAVIIQFALAHRASNDLSDAMGQLKATLASSGPGRSESQAFQNVILDMIDRTEAAVAALPSNPRP